MSYRYNPTPSFTQSRPEQRLPSARALMVALLGAFIVISLLVLLAGRVPFVPTPNPVQGSTYREYVTRDRELLGSYGYTIEGNVHIPVERAMDLIVEQNRLPVRDNPSATP